MREILARLRAALPEIIPLSDKDLAGMLRAARHVLRYPATDTRRGRPGRWSRELLLKVATLLADVLDRETSSRVSVASFIDHYLRIPDFPGDVIEPLSRGEINLFEAEQIARVTARRLASSPAESLRTRAALLSTHLQTKASGERLRMRVNEILRRSADEAPVTDGDESRESHASEELEDFDPYDSTHLFWEQIKQLGFAFREIRRADVTDEEIEELLRASEPILMILNRIQRRKGQKSTTRLKI